MNGKVVHTTSFADDIEVVYGFVFNRQTEHTSDYILFKKNGRTVKSMLPVSYFWMEFCGVESLALEYGKEWDDIWFEEVRVVGVDASREKYAAKYGEYYRIYDLVENNALAKINELGSFLEHFLYKSYIKNPLTRIAESIFSPYKKDSEYISVVGGLVNAMTTNIFTISKEEYLFSLVNDELDLIEEYIKK